jgi:hypothetical protein
VKVIEVAAQFIASERMAPPRHVTFDPRDWAVLARCWHPVARADELGDKPIQAQLLDVDLVVESQKPEDLPLDLQMETHIAADRTSIAYRKLLRSMGLGAMYVS